MIPPQRMVRVAYEARLRRWTYAVGRARTSRRLSWYAQTAWATTAARSAIRTSQRAHSWCRTGAPMTRSQWP